MPRTKAPVGELGAPGITSGLDGWLDTGETTPELMWPHSVHIYDRMRNDAHIESGLDAMHLPIERSTWDLDPAITDVRPEVEERVRRTLGLARKGEYLRRPRGALKFGDVVRHALLEDVFGHMLFEKVWDVSNGEAHLLDIAPRMPKTIQGWDLDTHGRLQGIKQLVPRPNGMWDEVPIGINRLAVFTRRKEGSDPTGRSILRSCYIHWLMKQQLIKVDAMAGERNGMGFPIVEYDPNEMLKKEALDLASNARAGETAGAAIPQGAAKFTLEGVTGSVREILPSIKYHDQEISRRMLAMFLDLGHDDGARALGETFVDFFVMALQSSADHIAQVINDDIIRDIVEYNYGPDEPYPLVRCDEITADSDLTAESLKQLAEAGYIVPDQRLEEILRQRYGLPAPAPSAVAEEPVDEGTIAGLEAQVAKLKAGPRTAPTRVPSGP